MIRAGLILALVGGAALAETWRVEPGGDLAAVAARAKPGDEIVLAPGSHRCGVSLSCRGTLTQPIVVRAEPGAVCRGRVSEIAGPERVPGDANLAWYAAPELPVACLTPSLYDPRLVIDTPYRQVAARADLATERWAWWPDPESGRLLVTWPGNGPPPATLVALHDGAGLNVNGRHLRLYDLCIQRVAGPALQIAGAEDVVVRRANISAAGYLWSGAVQIASATEVSITDSRVYRVCNGFRLNDTTRIHLAYNLLYATRAHGILTARCTDTIIRNNIIWAGGPSGSALYLGIESTEGLDLDWNCYRNYNGAGALIVTDNGKSAYGTFSAWRAAAGLLDRHSIAADPLFRDLTPGREDFHLLPASPCRPGIGPRDLQ